MPRFVILEHDHPFLHWDLMLEAGTGLRTWRLNEPLASGRDVAATDLALHRPMYLDYEGPVSGGRGRVQRWDAGTFAWVEDGPERVVVALAGKRAAGTLTLSRNAGSDWLATLS